MKITWYSNAPWAPTGYGQQTREVVPRLVAAGHEVAIAANYGLNGAAMSWPEHPDVMVFPAGVEQHSTSLSPAHHEAWGGDWLFTLYDVWPLKREFFPDNVVSWTPIDHRPAPPDVVRWCKTVRTVAMSRFGEQQLREQGVESDYVPHGIDTHVFTPDGLDARHLMDVPSSAFLVAINAANKGLVPARKAWFEMFVACSMFMRKHDDAYLYVHTDANSPIGLKLEKLARICGLDERRVRWADPYSIAAGTITQADLASYYRSADVLLATSMGEGFGIPVIEAQACGTTVIVSEFSAQPELVGAGWTVIGQSWWDEAQNSMLFTPSISDTLKRLDDAYVAKGDHALRQKAVDFAAEYDSDVVFERYWKPFLAKLESTNEPPLAVRPNRAERRRAKKARRAA